VFGCFLRRKNDYVVESVTVVMKEGAAPEIGRGIKEVMTAIFGAPSS
jgi:hypothetical protein